MFKKSRPAAMQINPGGGRKRPFSSASSSPFDQPSDPSSIKKSQEKEQEPATTAVVIPWIVMPGVERDIIIDRCRKEIAPLLGHVSGPSLSPSPTAMDTGGMEGEKDAEEGTIDSPSTSDRREGKGRKKRRAKNTLMKMYSSKEGSPLQHFARRHLCIGINEVTKALEKGQLDLFFICRDVKPPRLVEHLAICARFSSPSTPYLVLPKATGPLGAALGMKRIAALGFRKRDDLKEEGGGGDQEVDEGDRRQMQERLKSFLDLVKSKTDYLNLYIRDRPVVDEEGGAETQQQQEEEDNELDSENDMDI